MNCNVMIQVSTVINPYPHEMASHTESTKLQGARLGFSLALSVMLVLVRLTEV